MNVACLLFDDEVGPDGHSDGDVVARAHVMRCWAPLVSAISAVTTGQPIRSGPMPQVQPSSPKPPRVRAAGFEIANVAVQLIGDRPRFGSRRAEAELVME